MLRVLVILPFYGGSLPVGRFAAAGLREANCLVEEFEAPDFYPAYTAAQKLKVSAGQLDALLDTFLRFVSQAILARVDSFAPDLVLCLAQAPLSRSALQRLRKDGIPTAMWFVEDYRLFTYWRAFAPWYDLFAVIQKEPFFSELSRIGVNNVLYLPLAASPDFHRPLCLTPDEKKDFAAPLSFLGAGYPNRRKAFLRFIDRGLKIWGTEWDDEPGLAPLLQREGARISSEDSVRIFNATDINLNLHSSVNIDHPVGRDDFVNPRTFEIAACGAFQLVDHRSLMPELFAENEMAVFNDLAELELLVAHFRNRPEERRAFAERGRERVLADHSYAARMRTLLDFAVERLDKFGYRKEQWPEDMPPDMRSSLQQLMDELNLPTGANFGDVITAVRSKNERLSEVETALLFLDEWRKMYLPDS